MSSRKANELREDHEKIASDPGQLGPESAGQSGDTQGLEFDNEASDETVQELAEDDQAYEAEAVEGVEEAGDHPERPVRSHEDRRPWHDSELPPEPDWK